MKNFLRQVDWFVYAGFIVTLGLIIAGFIIPPEGVIDSSVLIAVGEINGFSSLFVFLFNLPKYIEAGAQVKFEKGDIKVTVSSDESIDINE